MVTDQRDAQIISLLWTSLLPFHGGDVLCFEVKCFDVLMSVAGSGHVMVTSFDAMWWLVLCHVTWCNAMSWWWAVLLQYYSVLSVLQSTTPVLPCTTKYYTSTTKYYLVLQSTTPVLTCTTKYCSSTSLYYKVLLCTTKYCSSTTLYYKVLLQYYPVLQSTTLYCKVLLQYYPALQSTSPVLLCTTKYYSNTTPYYKYHSVYSSTTLYYKVLLKYYSVLQSTTPILLCTTPVLPCTTKYYSSTTLYYKVLLQYYSVLQSITPVLPCTTKYYSSTTLYYKVLLQYYSVLQSTTPILLRITNTTLYYSSTTLYYKVLLKYYSSTTLYYKVLLQYYPVLQSTSWLIRITYETAFTMRGATVNTLQPYQILRLLRKMNLMTDPHHIWNVIYNARSDRHHLATSPNTAPATQKECHDWSASHMKRHLQCAERQASPCNLTKYCACHAKGVSWLICITWNVIYNAQSNSINLQPHQILRLPRQRSVLIDPHHIWNVIYNARSDRHQPPTSPNTAPATQNCSRKSLRNVLKTAEVAFPMRDRSETVPSMIRPWSEHDPTQKTQTATRRATEGTFRTRQEQILLKITTFPAPAIIPNFTTCCACHEKWHMNFTKCCACHAKWISWLIRITHETSFTMRGATDITLQPHQILRLPRKMNLMIDPHHIWNVIYNVRSNSQHPPTSPNTAPATQNDHPTSDRNLLKTAETSFPMRDRSEHDPRPFREWCDPENANRNPPRRQGYFSH